jgi:hypothetical protein
MLHIFLEVHAVHAHMAYSIFFKFILWIHDCMFIYNASNINAIRIIQI